MNKITTPIAVLISGILIFIGLYLNYYNSKFYVTEHAFSDVSIPVKINIHTGQMCVTTWEEFTPWKCYDKPNPDFFNI